MKHTNLTRTLQYYGVTVTPDVIDNVFAAIQSDTPIGTDDDIAAQVMTTVSNYTNVSVNDMKGRRRTKENVTARQLAIVFVHTFTSPYFGLKQIGKIFGMRHHTTVIHSKDAITNFYNKENKIRQSYDELLSELSQDFRIRRAIL